MDNQVAGNNRPLYPKVDHYWFKVAHNYEPLALQVGFNFWNGRVPDWFRVEGLPLALSACCCSESK